MKGLECRMSFAQNILWMDSDAEFQDQQRGMLSF